MLQVSHNGGLCNSFVECRAMVSDTPWHVGVQNLLGSLLFLLGSGAGTLYSVMDGLNDRKQQDISNEERLLKALWVEWPYLVGAFCFLLAATLELWLWKNERFGLAFARPLNRFAAIDDVVGHMSTLPHNTLDAALTSMGGQHPIRRRSGSLNGDDPGLDVDDHGPGPRKRPRVHLSHMVAIFIYCLGCSASIMDLCFAGKAVYNGNHPDAVNQYVLDNCCEVLLFSLVLVLHSVVHHSHMQPPFTGLLKALRFVMILFTCDKFWEFARWMKAGDWTHEQDDDFV